MIEQMRSFSSVLPLLLLLLLTLASCGGAPVPSKLMVLTVEGVRPLPVDGLLPLVSRSELVTRPLLGRAPAQTHQLLFHHMPPVVRAGPPAEATTPAAEPIADTMPRASDLELYILYYSGQ